VFFERPRHAGEKPEQEGEPVLLVHLTFPLASEFGGSDPEEFRELVRSAGGQIGTFIGGQRQTPDPKYFVGLGKLEEIKQALEETGAALVIFDHGLSPSQERNLEQFLSCRVLDRTGLILDIFAQRARTHEGKLQVELAQLRHASTRLVRGWTHLERQKGGIGLRGPGETQLETDRRLIRGRIASIERRLSKVRSQRRQGRRSRDRHHVPTVALVGYTNAGKSTLFNRLTAAEVYAADQLFATLDPTMRRIKPSSFGPYILPAVILADTVGFISHLPHQLVEAFRATLEEVVNADLLLHVTDCASPERDQHRQEVQQVLKEIGAESVPVLEIMNKLDLLEGRQAQVDYDNEGKPWRVWLSAETGLGITELLQSLDILLADDVVDQELVLKPEQFNLRAELFKAQAVVGEQVLEDGSARLHIRLPRKNLLSLVKRYQPDMAGELC
jgi:GTP-binding protein HflX